MANEKKKVAVLVSGGGTNLQAILDAEKSGSIKSGEVSVVVSSKDGAYALMADGTEETPAEEPVSEEASEEAAA